MYNRIDLILTPSRGVGYLAIVPWLIMAGFVVTAGVHGASIMLALLIPIAVSAILHYRRFGRLSGQRTVRRLTLRSDGLWAKLEGSEELRVYVDPSSRLLSWLALLKLRAKDSNDQFTVVIASAGNACTNTCDDEFRKLRVWLRLGQSGESASTNPQAGRTS